MTSDSDVNPLVPGRRFNVDAIDPAEMFELLISVRAICLRKGVDTAWARLDESIARLGVGNVTARVYKVLPSDKEPGA